MGKHKFTLTKKKIFAAIGVVILLLAALGAGFAVWFLQHGQTKTSTSPQIGDKPPSVAVDNAQNLALSGKTDEANKAIQDALKNSSLSTQERQLLLVQQGVTYGNAGDHQKALDSYLEAEKVTSNFTTSHLIGEEAEALGKKDMAAEYYKKALSQLDSKAPSYESDKEVYEAKLKAVGG